MPVIEINVRDRAGNPAVRSVRVHRRDTGEVIAEVLSNGLSGAARLSTEFRGEAYVVVLDDVAGVTEPDRIVRMVI